MVAHRQEWGHPTTPIQVVLMSSLHLQTNAAPVGSKAPLCMVAFFFWCFQGVGDKTSHRQVVRKQNKSYQQIMFPPPFSQPRKEKPAVHFTATHKQICFPHIWVLLLILQSSSFFCLPSSLNSSSIGNNTGLPCASFIPPHTVAW